MNQKDFLLQLSSTVFRKPASSFMAMWQSKVLAWKTEVANVVYLTTLNILSTSSKILIFCHFSTYFEGNLFQAASLQSLMILLIALWFEQLGDTQHPDCGPRPSLVYYWWGNNWKTRKPFYQIVRKTKNTRSTRDVGLANGGPWEHSGRHLGSWTAAPMEDSDENIHALVLKFVA